LEEEKKLIINEQESKEDQWKRERDQERQIFQRTVTEWRVRSEHWERVAGEETHRRIEEEKLRLDDRRIRMDEERRFQDEIQSLRREVEMLRISASWNAPAGPFGSKPSGWGPITPTSKDFPILPLPTPQHFSSVGCKDCGTNGRCECIEEVLKALPEPVLQDDGPSSTKLNVEPYDAMEIDFTAKFAKRGGAVAGDNSKNQDSLMSMGTPLSSAEHCGFCTDDANCICRASVLDNAINNEPTSLVSPPDSTYGERNSYAPPKPQPVEPSLSSKGPGSCPACMDDPERRRFCQTLAGLMPPPPLPRQSSNQTYRSHEDVFAADSSDKKISCADAYTKLSMDPQFEAKKDSIAFMQKLRTQPAPKDKACMTCESKGCSAFEVDCASVLAAMRGSGEIYGGQNSST